MTGKRVVSGMKFMQAYKRLDNLCRDMNGIGVTGYLQDMESAPEGRFCVPGWNDDLRRLKHYRHLRNRIAHEDDADEEELCTAGDADWLEDFHERILERTDPLSVYFSFAVPKSEPAVQKHGPAAPLQAQRQPRGCTPELFMAAVVLAALTGLVFLGAHIAATFF